MSAFSQAERVAFRKGAESAEAKVRAEYDDKHMDRIATALEGIHAELCQINLNTQNLAR